MNANTLRDVVSKCTYRDKRWKLCSSGMVTGELLLWWEFYDHNSALQKSRKWPVSSYAIPSEVVQTAFLALLQAQEHETREGFTYRMEPIFGPHYDVDDLVELRQSRQEVHREDKREAA